MQSCAIANNSRYFATVITLAVSVTLLMQTPVFAETEIQADICASGAGASVQITSPVTDSVISSLPVAVEGTVAQTSQIDIAIDGVYTSTVPVGANQTTFTYNLNLNEGTHSIRFVANDRCHVANGSVDLVLTYQSSTTPSTGGTTDTTVGDSGPTVPNPLQSNFGGVKIGVAAGANLGNQPATNQSLLFVIMQPFYGIAAMLDIDNTLKDGIVQGVVRVIMIVAGAFMASVGSASYVSMLEFFKQTARAARVKKYFAVNARVRESVFRLGGLALFILALLI
jgi:hypothetical protein